MEGNQHTHTHDHHLDHGHGHANAEHRHGGSRLARVRHRFAHLARPHGHEAGDKVDAAMQTSREGMRTLWISLAVLGLTTVVQAVIVVLSGV